MGIEVSTDTAICFKCGHRYNTWKGNFPISYAPQHKGAGHLPVCKQCIDTMYNQYLAQCSTPKDAVRQMCRKLDLYWDGELFDLLSTKNTTQSIIRKYIAKLNTASYAGKCYDDTLSCEGTLWDFSKTCNFNDAMQNQVGDAEGTEEQDNEFDEYVRELTSYPVTKDVIAFWGAGYTRQMYAELEQRRAYWMSRFSKDVELDPGAEALIRQICSLELDINRGRMEGKPIEKYTNALNNLLGSANLKPAQKTTVSDSSIENTPFGVWIQKWETERPIPEPDPELQDVDGVIKYISIWFLGHLCKMLNIKNTYSKLYEDKINEMRIDRPEYDDEDDENMFYDIFGSGDDDDGS